MREKNQRAGVTVKKTGIDQVRTRAELAKMSVFLHQVNWR
jgi:hypothetical protein